MTQHSLKICPSCREKEITGFSTCRFCGTRYDAVISENKVKIDIFGILAIILVIGSIFYYAPTLTSIRWPRFVLMNKSIEVAGRPRLIELYTNWNGCPNGCKKVTAYNTIVEKCQAEYGTKIDFRMLNVDDENNRALAHKLGGGLIALPAIYLFNRSGEEVAEFTDQLTYAELDKQLQDPKLFR